MVRSLFATMLIIGLFSVPLAAQPTYIEFSYQSFRPFIHFQLNLGNSYSYYHDPYEEAYLKGYMDGVNDAYYYDYRFYDLVRDIDIYEAGYRDGYRDRDLMIHLRGYDWYSRHIFAYDDYHSPYYSVQIWLSGLSLAFLHAPEHRLPPHWKRRAHREFIEYRHWHKHRHRYNDRDYRHYIHIERDFEKRFNRLQKEAHRERSRYQKQRGRDGYLTGRIERFPKVDKRQAQQKIRQSRQQRNSSRTVQTSHRNRTIENTLPKPPSNRRIEAPSRVNRERGTTPNRDTKIKRNNNSQREAIRSNDQNRGNHKRTVRKANNRTKSRGTIERNQSGKKSNSRIKGRGNNGRGN